MVWKPTADTNDDGHIADLVLFGFADSRIDTQMSFNIVSMSSSSLWQRFQQYFLYYRDPAFSVDISRMKFPDDFFEKMRPKIDNAFAAMRALEAGAIANPTEKRMVGHYWLRNPTLAPTREIRTEIEETVKRIKTFAADIRGGKITGENGKSFKHAVAVTGVGSDLDKYAEKNGWLARFPMHDWIGGRTSVMSAVGLLPMAFQGFDIDDFLAGASAMDEHTRTQDVTQNAAMLLALMWYYAGNGKGEKDMVILPYKDRLALFAKYLQQLVMESLGKEKDLEGKIVHQGIAVYGNKGSTDQHAYVQQLRDGVLNFFVTFIEADKDLGNPALEVEEGVTSGDYLHAVLRRTRSALYESGRESITISIPEVNAFDLGALIALYERAVGFYGSLINVNAYDQPGVKAGKKAAPRPLQLQKQVSEKLAANEGKTAEEIARSIDADPEDVFHRLRHLAD